MKEKPNITVHSQNKVDNEQKVCKRLKSPENRFRLKSVMAKEYQNWKRDMTKRNKIETQ